MMEWVHAVIMLLALHRAMSQLWNYCSKYYNQQFQKQFLKFILVGVEGVS